MTKRYSPGVVMVADQEGAWIPAGEAFTSCGCGFKGTKLGFDTHDCVKMTAQAESRELMVENLILEAQDWNMNNFGLESGKDLRDHLQGIIEKMNNGTYRR